MEKEAASSGSVRFVFLAGIAGYAVLLAAMTQVSSADYKRLAAVVMGGLLGHALLVSIYLRVNGLKDWKLLAVATGVVVAFAGELAVRVSA